MIQECGKGPEVLTTFRDLDFVRIEIGDRKWAHIPRHCSRPIDAQCVEELEESGRGVIVVVERNHAVRPSSQVGVSLRSLQQQDNVCSIETESHPATALHVEPTRSLYSVDFVRELLDLTKLELRRVLGRIVAHISRYRLTHCVLDQFTQSAATFDEVSVEIVGA